jgi:hypothetical protein
MADNTVKKPVENIITIRKQEVVIIIKRKGA